MSICENFWKKTPDGRDAMHLLEKKRRIDTDSTKPLEKMHQMRNDLLLFSQKLYNVYEAIDDFRAKMSLNNSKKTTPGQG